MKLLLDKICIDIRNNCIDTICIIYSGSIIDKFHDEIKYKHSDTFNNMLLLIIRNY